MTGFTGMSSCSPEPPLEPDEDVARFLATADAVFGPLLPKRACGCCTACCTVPAIEPLAKPADTACVHCTGLGCSIYEKRPQPCRSFFCAWRRMKELPENLRPDKCGVVLMPEYDPHQANPFDRLCIVARWIDTPPDLEAPVAQKLLKLFRKMMIPLFISAPGSTRKYLVHPSPAIYRAIVDGTEPEPKLAQQAASWRNALSSLIKRNHPEIP